MWKPEIWWHLVLLDMVLHMSEVKRSSSLPDWVTSSSGPHITRVTN